MASHVASPPPYTELNNPKLVEGCYPAPSFPPQQPGPPQQQMIIAQQPVAPTFVYQPHPVSMTGAIVLSCVVFWCFGWLFGAIAFILAIIGSDSSQNGNISGALRLRNASYGVSIAGILIGIIVIIIIVVSVKGQDSHTSCHLINGVKVCG